MSRPVPFARTALLALVGVLATVLLPGCGNSSGAEARGAGGAFPVSIPNAYGTTVIEKQPKRVVSIGYHEQDILLALGVQPVAVQQWMPEYKDAIGPWARSLVKGTKPKVFSTAQTEPNLEAIAKLEPDLIVSTYRDIQKNEYQLLSDIAPTLIKSKAQAALQVPYDEETLTIGRALGKKQQAAALVEKTKRRFAEAREAHPEFTGKTVAVAYPLKDGGLGVYSSDDPRSQFFRNLGFTVPKSVDRLTKGRFYAKLSPERLGLVGDVDLLVVVDFHLGEDLYANNKLYQNLDVVQRGHAIYPLPYTNAISFNTVLSIPYCLDKVTPVIAKALRK